MSGLAMPWSRWLFACRLNPSGETSMQKLARTFAVASMALAAFAPALSAQKQQGSDADTREIAAYRLSMDGLKKMENAMQAFAAAAKKDPRYAKQMKLKAQIDTLKNKEDLSDAESEKLETLQQELEQAEASTDDGSVSKAQSLTEMAAAMDRQPMLANALKSAGLTAREYSVMSMALLQASMWAGMKKQGMVKEKDIPKDVNPANIAFVEQHQAEMAALTERMKKLGGEQ
jgi:hypothetical protein